MSEQQQPPDDDLLDRDLRHLARFLDTRFQGPFGVRVGWDPIIGLIPGVGDLLTTGLSGYIVFRAAMSGASVSVVLRMILNIFVDNLIDLIPLVGWLGDFAWKANIRNLNLMRSHRLDPVRTQRSSRLVVLLIVGIGLAIVMALSILTGLLFVWAVRMLMSFV